MEIITGFSGIGIVLCSILGVWLMISSTLAYLKKGK